MGEDFKFDKWIPSNKKAYVTFDRKNSHYCIYCGEKSNTREHIPSRDFLSEPYPEDLSVLPACETCNNSFSYDELYTAVYIDSLKHLSGYSSCLSLKNKERIYKNSAFFDAQNDLKMFFESGFIPNNNRIERILLKLSVGHMIYELSEGYGGVEWTSKPKSIEYNFAFGLSKPSIEDFDSIELINDKSLPELGTRVYNNILVLEANRSQYENVSDPKERSINPLVFMNWVDVQDGNYRYLAWMENNNTFVIKIVIDEFCYAKVEFEVTNCE